MDSALYSIELKDRVVPHLFAAQVERRGEQAFMTFGDSTYSYTDADACVRSLAGQLRSHGIGRGSRVLVQMGNSDRMVLLVLAILHVGGVVVPLNNAASGQYLGYFIGDSQAAHMVVEPETVGNVESAHADGIPLPALLLMPDGSAASHHVVAGQVLPELRPDAEPGGAPDHPDPLLTFKDPGFIVYTSGTTGRSKGVVSTHAHAVSVGMVLPRMERLSSEDRLLIYMPLFHASSLWSSLLSAIAIGASVAVMQRFSASRFWRQSRELGATQFVAMGGIAEILKLQPPSPDDRNHGIRVGYSAPLPADPAGFEERFGVPLASGYGMTELPPVANSAPSAGYADRAFAGPVQTDFSEVRIVDDDDLALPPGKVGEIVVRPAQPWTGFMEYLGKPEETVGAQRNLWFHTGDLGSLDANGNLYLRGRKNEVIRRRGEFVSPLELEEALSRLPGIADLVAIPVPSALGEDDIVLAVTVHAGAVLAPEEIRAFAAETLPRHMVPRYIAMLTELPRTPTGKVEKLRLRDELLADPSRLWDGEESSKRSTERVKYDGR